MKYSGQITLLDKTIKHYSIDKESNILVVVGDHLSGKSLLLKSIKDSNRSEVSYTQALCPNIAIIETYCYYQKDRDILNKHLKEFFPDQDFVLSYNKNNPSWAKVELNGVPINTINSGIVNFLYILAKVLFTPERCLVIDDIESHLSFDVQKKLSALIRKHYEANKDQEVIVTTHSPFILESLASDTVDIGMLFKD